MNKGGIKMENFAKINLEATKQELNQKLRNVETSLGALINKKSDFAEHHQHLINTYMCMIDEIDFAIYDSESIGKGA